MYLRHSAHQHLTTRSSINTRYETVAVTLRSTAQMMSFYTLTKLAWSMLIPGGDRRSRGELVRPVSCHLRASGVPVWVINFARLERSGGSTSVIGNAVVLVLPVLVPGSPGSPDSVVGGALVFLRV